MRKRLIRSFTVLQSSYLFKNYSKKAIKVLRWILPILVGILVWRQLLARQSELSEVGLYFKRAFTSGYFWWIPTTLFLSGINWAIEARKWQLLASKLETLSFTTAFKAVLAGQALGFVSQANVGDATGKMGFLSAKNRLTSIGAFLLGSMLQFLVTLVAGTLAYAYFLWLQPSAQGNVSFGILVLLFLGNMLIFWMIFNKNRAVIFLQNKTFAKKFVEFLAVSGTYSPQETARLWAWCGLRFATFSVQFLLVLYGFGLDLPLLHQLTVVWLLFLTKSIIPAFSFVSDLGIRAFSTLYFFGFFDANPALVTSAALGVWVFNVLFPVMIGTLFLWQLRYFKDK